MRSLHIRIKHAHYMKEWRKKNPSSYKTSYQRYFQSNREKVKVSQLKYRQKIRNAVLDHYGKKCNCCGENTIEFLVLDHINNDGNKHRKIVKGKIPLWAYKNGFPDLFQILCFNCNMAKSFFGKCPHSNSTII